MAGRLAQPPTGNKLDGLKEEGRVAQPPSGNTLDELKEEGRLAQPLSGKKPDELKEEGRAAQLPSGNKLYGLLLTHLRGGRLTEAQVCSFVAEVASTNLRVLAPEGNLPPGFL